MRGLRVIDVSTPSAPVEVGFLDTPGDASGVAVAGGYAVATTGAGLGAAVDVGQPGGAGGGRVRRHSRLGPAVSRSQAPTPTWRKRWEGIRGGLGVIDVSTPSGTDRGQTRRRSKLRPGMSRSQPATPTSRGGRPCLRVIDVSDPVGAGRGRDRRTLQAGAWGVAVAGGYASRSGRGERPGWSGRDHRRGAGGGRVQSTLQAGGRGDVAVAGGYAYVADGGTAGLGVVDVANPAAQLKMGVLGILRVTAPASRPRLLRLRGGASSGGLRVVDVANPAAPTGGRVRRHSEAWPSLSRSQAATRMLQPGMTGKTKRDRRRARRRRRSRLASSKLLETQLISPSRVGTPTLRTTTAGLRVIDVSDPVGAGGGRVPSTLQAWPSLSRSQAATPTWRTTALAFG